MTELEKIQKIEEQVGSLKLLLRKDEEIETIILGGELNIQITNGKISSATKIRKHRLEDTKYEEEPLRKLIAAFIMAVLKDIDNRNEN